MSNQHLRVGLAGLLVNLALSALKIMAGLFGGSRAVLSDGVHSLSDVTTDIGVIFSARYCTEPADRQHPYGHGRVDILISLGISLFMAAAGLGLLISAAGHLLRSTETQPGLIALWAAIVSLVGKEVLFRWTHRRALLLKSPSLQTNAWHHRSDAFSSIPVIVAVVGARYLPGWHFLDSVGGLIVSLLILKLAWKLGFKALRQLSDTAAPADTVRAIKQLADNVQGVKEVHQIRTRFLGRGWGVDLHVLVDSKISVRSGHQIADQVKEALLGQRPDVVDIVVHIEPDGDHRPE